MSCPLLSSPILSHSPDDEELEDSECLLLTSGWTIWAPVGWRPLEAPFTGDPPEVKPSSELCRLPPPRLPDACWTGLMSIVATEIAVVGGESDLHQTLIDMLFFRA